MRELIISVVVVVVVVDVMFVFIFNCFLSFFKQKELCVVKDHLGEKLRTV